MTTGAFSVAYSLTAFHVVPSRWIRQGTADTLWLIETPVARTAPAGWQSEALGGAAWASEIGLKDGAFAEDAFTFEAYVTAGSANSWIPGSASTSTWTKG